MASITFSSPFSPPLFPRLLFPSPLSPSSSLDENVIIKNRAGEISIPLPFHDPLSFLHLYHGNAPAELNDRDQAGFFSLTTPLSFFFFLSYNSAEKKKVRHGPFPFLPSGSFPSPSFLPRMMVTARKAKLSKEQAVDQPGLPPSFFFKEPPPPFFSPLPPTSFTRKPEGRNISHERISSFSLFPQNFLLSLQSSTPMRKDEEEMGVQVFSYIPLPPIPLPFPPSGDGPEKIRNLLPLPPSRIPIFFFFLSQDIERRGLLNFPSFLRLPLPLSFPFSLPPANSIEWSNDRRKRK